jgi:hypothetical protein
MFFEDNYKTICILGYFFAALGAIVTAALEFGWIQTKPPKALYYAYFIGGVITMKCAYGWLTNTEKK